MTIETAPGGVEANLVELFQHLGIERAHIASGGPPAITDWQGLATSHPDRIASLIIPSPPLLDPTGLRAVADRLLIVAGDAGTSPLGANRLLAELPGAEAHFLRGYGWEPWSDVALDRGPEFAAALLDFLDRHPLDAVALSEGEGEAAGITYRIRGAGPPLVLMPLALAPSQWEPLIDTLSARYCTISLAGPLLGVVGILEGRGRSPYLAMVRSVLDLVGIEPGEVVLEVGGGSGVVLREIARRTGGANPIIDIDINPYLLREAKALADQAGLAELISFREGSAEAIPLAANRVDVALSFTVLEEGDAERMLAELVRVTKPGGRVAAIVRAIDMPGWVTPELSAAVLAKISRPGMAAGGKDPRGCGDTSLYQRFHEVGLTRIACLPQFAPLSAEETSRIAIFKQRVLAVLDPDERREFLSAVARAEADGTFAIAAPYHCAVGTKPG
ncbi:MAG TPA: methyltransferase domain-containing protein [Stellaceae bacterium]|nr:methyltransferase domain-containing protein [Stellaceae bacterium]